MAHTPPPWVRVCVCVCVCVCMCVCVLHVCVRVCVYMHASFYLPLQLYPEANEIKLFSLACSASHIGSSLSHPMQHMQSHNIHPHTNKHTHTSAFRNLLLSARRTAASLAASPLRLAGHEGAWWSSMRPGGEGLAARLNSSLLHLSCSTSSSSARPAREAGWKWYVFVAGSLQINRSAQITKWKRIGPATTWMVISDYLISKTFPRGVCRYSYVPPDTPLYSSRCLCTHHLPHTQMHACPYTGAFTHILQP